MTTPQDDPFELFGIAPSFQLDADALRRDARKRIARQHPDRLDDPVERDEAVGRIAALNEALSLLLDDERRANILLHRLGGPSAEQDPSLPPAFLMEILEVREDMEAALSGGDPAERERVEGWARSERSRLHDEVGALFARLADGEPVGSEIRLQLNVWRYIERMIEQLDPDGLDPFATPRER